MPLLKISEELWEVGSEREVYLPSHVDKTVEMVAGATTEVQLRHGSRKILDRNN